jgi:ATP-binding cassette subfamily C protein CydC
MNQLLHAAMANQKRTIRWGVLCAILAGLSAVGLLAVSGWFLAGAAAAGLGGTLAVQGFNSLLPSAAIRAAAILRTGTRYGERLLSHRAALFALAQLRTTLFGRIAARALAGQNAGRSGTIANQLGRDVDALEDAVIRQVSRPGVWAAGLAGFAATLLPGWLPALVLLATMAAMRLAAKGLALRTLPDPLNRAAAAYAALQADYADMAGPCADIAVYGLAPALSEALANEAVRHDAARHDVIRAEALIGASQTIIASLGVAVMAGASQGPAPIFALALLGAMAALEAWAGLAATDMRSHHLALAQTHLATLAEPLAPAPEAPSLALTPDLTLCGQTIPYGSRVLVVGASGAGKTRLIETLVGLRQDAPQALAVSGVSPTSLGMAALRPIFALCPQDAQLIAGSVADNLTLARAGMTEAAMWQALEAACADYVVRGLPDGLQQWLGGDGARLSGGQRRRIALARALLADCPWLVLDEPSEGLDAATEARLVASLDRWLANTGKGLVLVSHRPAMAALAELQVEL